VSSAEPPRRLATRGKVSAGLLMYRRDSSGQLEVFLVHPGGPFFAKKDLGYWTVPKGLPEPAEQLGSSDGTDLLATARREFTEETGLASVAPFVWLGSIKQRGGKVVHAWAFEGDTPDGFVLQSNLVQIQWPPRSGRTQMIPEVDDGRFFALDAARRRINAAQAAFLDRLVAASAPA
jgi:predicted NUDIX family NTP pyrophosphohydrolase